LIDNKTEFIKFRVTKELKEQIKENAAKKGLTVSAYLTMVEKEMCKDGKEV